MGYVKCSYDDLKDLCITAFKKLGFSEEDSITITDVLLMADLYGIESHGVQRLFRYYQDVQRGMMKVNASIDIVHETPISVVLDANDGMGQVVAKKAMELAIEKAKETGIGMANVRNSNHYGIAGYYAKMAADEGLLGISMTNSAAIAVPTYGSKAMMGSNPIAIAMPAKPTMFLFDSSTCVVTRGKLEVYNKKGAPLPIGWAIDHTGHDSSDAKTVLDDIANKLGGGILPLGGSTEKLGGHKGYGYAVLVELFAASFSGALTSNKTYEGNRCGIGHAFIAVDYGIFGDKELIEENFSDYLQELRDSPKAEGAARIYTHGEKEMEAYENKMEQGIPVNENTIKQIDEICKNLKMNINNYIKPIK